MNYAYYNNGLENFVKCLSPYNLTAIETAIETAIVHTDYIGLSADGRGCFGLFLEPEPVPSQVENDRDRTFQVLF